MKKIPVPSALILRVKKQRFDPAYGPFLIHTLIQDSPRPGLRLQHIQKAGGTG